MITKPLSALFVSLIVSSAILPASAQGLELSLPINCQIGPRCFIQQYVDTGAGKGSHDYTCGGQSYDGHNGTDLRVRFSELKAPGIAVLSAAAGMVRSARDGLPDRLLRSKKDRSRVQNRECGNGVVIDHGAGWQTQYCHMRRNSLKVRPGEWVRQGQNLGLVGYSGLAQFAHLHLAVRHDGKVIDPFTGKTPVAGACRTGGGKPLWDATTAQALAYRPGNIVDVGFAEKQVSRSMAESGHAVGPGDVAAMRSMVAWIWAVNLQAGDRLEVSFKGPDDRLAVRHEATLNRIKAEYVLSTGRKRPPSGWPPGRYVAEGKIVRKGKTVLTESRTLVVP